MAEKITINVGVFSIEPSPLDSYNDPIGLALHDNNEGSDISVLLSQHGHHQSLYDAYMRTLPKTQQSKMPQRYYDAVAAFGFLRETEHMPVVYCTDRGRKRILAAKALSISLESHTHVIQPDDNKIYPMRVSIELLDTAIVQNSDDTVVV